MSDFRKFRDKAEDDIKSAHTNLSLALSEDTDDEWKDSHIRDMHEALTKLNELKQLFK